MIDRIRNEKQYNQVMSLIENFIQKATDGGGFHSLSKKEADELERLGLLAEKFEDEVLKVMPMRLTISSVVQAKKEELGVTQKGLASMLGISAPKLSQILSGKREPDVPFLKSLHEKLGIDGNFILQQI
ncbi:antitoxin component HigA of HigAB toxin-antitoxin module [Arcticibacter tournemirensis]|uniref:Helix-turn-helix domain-containing protein n=1 Tax=Arcticibacter tournemirensis TaxID=699437 RepID=A0A5M9H849_9SPHI|nr:helix-turn-helix domain-containing protein [Arcticibacter tournemirensis]KAA8482041.1 helix-turn-helix domain-containing protein [Arcticibacter tournemirensis]TQM49447.1 antitoxin component HigA of HigAB toxin-antitoxin module [Arcticibacter tournemirensis]